MGIIPTSWSGLGSELFNPFDPNVGPKAALQKAGLTPSSPPGQTAAGPNDTWTTQPDGTKINQAGLVMQPDGTILQTPTAANQVASTGQAARDFFNSVPTYDQQQQQAYGQEQGLGATLGQMIQGNGPTVAGNQLAIGQQQAAQQQLAQAAGASGNNAALAHMAAMGNTAQLQSQTNQQAAQLRAQEQQNAIGAQANLFNNMANQGEGMSAQKAAAGTNLNNQADELEAGREKLNYGASAQGAATEANGFSALLNAV